MGLGQVCGHQATPAGIRHIPEHLPHVQGGLGSVCGSQAPDGVLPVPTQGGGSVEVGSSQLTNLGSVVNNLVLPPTAQVAQPFSAVDAVELQSVGHGIVHDVPRDDALGNWDAGGLHLLFLLNTERIGGEAQTISFFFSSCSLRSWKR